MALVVRVHDEVFKVPCFGEDVLVEGVVVEVEEGGASGGVFGPVEVEEGPVFVLEFG